MNMNDPIASLLGGWSTELNLYSVCFGWPYPSFLRRLSAVSAPASAMRRASGRLFSFRWRLPWR